jgi:hypothetical protein
MIVYHLTNSLLFSSVPFPPTAPSWRIFDFSGIFLYSVSNNRSKPFKPNSGIAMDYSLHVVSVMIEKL